MTRFPSFGALLTVDWHGGVAYGTIGQVRDIAGPSITRGDIEVPPDHDQASSVKGANNYKLHFPGVSDPGQLTFSINLDLNWGTHVGGAGTGLLGSFQDTWQGTSFPTWHYKNTAILGTALWSFDGYPVGMEFAMGDVEGSMSADLIIQIASKPTLAVS
jgi:hypothetical protein